MKESGHFGNKEDNEERKMTFSKQMWQSWKKMDILERKATIMKEDILETNELHTREEDKHDTNDEEKMDVKGCFLEMRIISWFKSVMNRTNKLDI